MDGIVKIRVRDGDSDSLHQAAEVYASVFSERAHEGESDEDVESFMERAWRYQDQFPDFRLLVAAAVVGLALGSGTMAGGWWYDAVFQQLSNEQRERWMPGPCFSVGELAVREDQRRRSIGERLLSGPFSSSAPAATAR